MKISDATVRNAFIRQQLDALTRSSAEIFSVRKQIEACVEAATSLQLSHRDRAALRAFLTGLIRRFRSGEIDDRTAYTGLNRLLMAASANSPEVLSVIHA